MPQQRMDIRMIKDILRLKFQGGLSHERIAQSLGVSKGAVAKYLSAYLPRWGWTTATNSSSDTRRSLTALDATRTGISLSGANRHRRSWHSLSSLVHASSAVFRFVWNLSGCWRE